MQNEFGINDALVISDSGWQADKFTSIPRRGIHDYNREILFDRELHPIEIQALKVWLESNNCPGWTGVMIRMKEEHQRFLYVCRTTWDSSD